MGKYIWYAIKDRVKHKIDTWINKCLERDHEENISNVTVALLRVNKTFIIFLTIFSEILVFSNANCNIFHYKELNYKSKLKPVVLKKNVLLMDLGF